MDSAAQAFAPYSPVAQLNAPTNHQHASVNDTTAWNHARVTTPLTPVQPPLFPGADRSTDLEYPSPTPSSSNASPSYAHIEQYATNAQFPSSAAMTSSTENTLAHLDQIESRVGPSRVMTRRQRAQMEQKSLGRRVPLRQHLQRAGEDSSSRLNAFLYPPEMARLHTSDGESAPIQRDRLSVNIGNPLSLQLQLSSYQPMTPASIPSPSYPYVYDNSRSTSGSTSNYQRVSSPALSCASALSSVSSASPPSHGFSPYPRPANHNTHSSESTKPKQKKQRLDNNARKHICVYQDDHPNARQEDIAAVFKVERSTISKILKHKSKWLSTPQNQGDRVAKHRPSKFPDIEEELEKWLAACTIRKITISDNAIRLQAKQIAKQLGYPEEKFKASAGWVENFKTRHRIRGGVWMGRDDKTRLLMSGAGDTFASPMNSPVNPAFGGPIHNHGANAPSSNHDDEMASQGSAGHGEQGLRAAEQQRVPSSSSVNGQVSWVDHNDSVPSTQSLGHSPLSTHHSIDQAHPASHLSMSSHQPAAQLEQSVHPEHYVEQTVYYHPGAGMPQSIPTLADAETALNTVILYIDAAGRRDLLLPDERDVLHTIKCALFQEASGVPFDRSTQA